MGATPVFADIDPATFNLDPAAAEAAVTERTRAIVAVHLFGQPADLPALREVADRHGLALIEDAAQAFGAALDGRAAGAFGDLATFSFFPTKNLPAMGDAGMVVPRSADLAERVRLLRFHGSRDKRKFEHVGDELAHGRDPGCGAAPVPARGRRLERRPPGGGRALRRLGLGDLVELPAEAPGTSHVYHLYVVRAARRATRSPRSLPRRRDRRRRLLRRPAPPPAGVRPPRLPAGRSARDRAGRARGPGAADVPDARRGRSSARSWRPCARRRSRPPEPGARCARLDRPHQLAARRHLRPADRRMRARGWDVAVTARAFAQTLELLELHGIDHTVIGHHGGGSRAGKARAAADRVAAMIRFGRRGRFDVALAHGSTDLPMACRVLRIPQHDHVRLRVRDAAALAQLPPGLAGARARCDPAGPRCAASACGRRGSCAIRG